MGLITNGTFSGDGSPWSINSPWELSSGLVRIPAGDHGGISVNQDTAMADATSYPVTFNINVPARNFDDTGAATGTLKVKLGGDDSGETISLGDYAGLGSTQVSFSRTSATVGGDNKTFSIEAYLVDILDGSYLTVDDVTLDGGGGGGGTANAGFLLNFI